MKEVVCGFTMFRNMISHLCLYGCNRFKYQISRFESILRTFQNTLKAEMKAGHSKYTERSLQIPLSTGMLTVIIIKTLSLAWFILLHKWSVAT